MSSAGAIASPSGRQSRRRWKCSLTGAGRRRASAKNKRRCSSVPSNTRAGELSGKVAWITGGGSGIGLAGAIELEKAGAEIVLSGRTRATLEAAQKRVKADVIVCDVGDKNEGASTAAQIHERHGRVDILINSAGINLPKRSFREVTNEGWDQIIAVNLSGMFYCVQAVLAGMRARKGGVIINVSSWGGRYAGTLTRPRYNATQRAAIAPPEPNKPPETTHYNRAPSGLPGHAAAAHPR